MEKYIPLDAVLAIIDEFKHKDYIPYVINLFELVCDIESSIKKLEVKEVDLEEEIERVRKTHFINDDFEKATLEGRQITNIARHFFELGIKAQKGEEA